MLAGRLPDHCEPKNSFLVDVSSTFHTCVPTPLAFISTALGVLSILSWLFAQLPQILKNHKLKSASGLSIYFLAEWLLGDLTNLLGALLTRQAAWQVVVAAYYVTVDVCLVNQYFWYEHFRPWREKRLRDAAPDYDHRGDDTLREVLIEIHQSQGRSPPSSMDEGDRKTNDQSSRSPATPKPFRNVNYSWSPKEKNTPSSSYRTIRRPPHSPSSGISPNTLLVISLIFAVLAKASAMPISSQDHTSPPDQSETVEAAGRVLSWMSTLLYLGSRLPQIYRNNKRRSTSGLSPTLFIAAFFGNLFYSSSLVANPLAWNDAPPYGLRGWADAEGNHRMTWIGLATPFFLGAAGVLAMDAILGIQFLIFGEAEAAPKVVVLRDHRGRSHWRKVSGWMRGWVPSPGPMKGGEDARPLLVAGPSGDERRYGGA